MIAILACGAIAAAPQKQDDAANKLIQQIVKAARGDVDTAAKLVAAAKTLQDNPKDQVAVCEKAYEYGTKTTGGLGSALEALDILDKADPGRGELWAERRIKVCRLLYYASSGKDEQRYGQLLAKALLKMGDAKSKPGSMKEAIGFYRQALSLAKRLGLAEVEQISAKLSAAVRLLEVQGVMDPLKARLKANPADKATRTRLIEMCLVSLDSPVEAAKYLSADCDESLRKYVPLAAKPLEELKETQCLELGRWYAQLVDKGTTQAGKSKAAGRAVRYYRRFLSDHTAKGAMAAAGALALKNLKERIREMGLDLPDDPGETPWVDLLKLIDLERCTIKGKWARKEEALGCAVSLYSLVAVPVTAAGSYDLHIVFAVGRGHTSAAILPVGPAQVALIVGAGRGQYIGLGNVDGKGPKDNPTTVDTKDKPEILGAGGKTTLDVRVRIDGGNAQITVLVNGKRIIAWSGKQSSLALSREWRIPSETFGLGASVAGVVWQAARLRRLDAPERNLKWVSKDATCKPSSVHRQETKRYSPLASFLTGEGKLYQDGFAFCTQAQRNPYVVVALAKPETIGRIFIENRRGEHWQQTEPLAVWLSADGRTWTPVWNATKARRSWAVDLKTPGAAKYIKIGLTGEKRASLALAGVRIYAPGE